MRQEAGSFEPGQTRMPVLFVGHGSPMNAIEDNEFSREWIAEGQTLPRPAGILCVSAHWETHGTQVTAMEQPRTIHDFGGFPPELYAQQYPAPGSPALAQLVAETLAPASVGQDARWGLDHGAWSVLARLFPGADVPVVQLSLNRGLSGVEHLQLGRALRPLRERGVLIVGSGNAVHNLWAACMDGPSEAYDWAARFDETVHSLIDAGDYEALAHYDRLGKDASMAIPTNEHYVPLLYALGAAEPGEPVRYFNEKLAYCSLSMRSLRIG